jgi:predicted nucleotidyltransferase
MLKKSTSSVQIFYPGFSRKEVTQSLRQKLTDLQKQLPCLLVVLFGSYARGNYTVASDVDLLVVYQGEENDQAYTTVKQVFRIPRLEPHVYAENDYLTMKDTIQKMIAGGVVIYRHE